MPKSLIFTHEPEYTTNFHAEQTGGPTAGSKTDTGEPSREGPPYPVIVDSWHSKGPSRDATGIPGRGA